MPKRSHPASAAPPTACPPYEVRLTAANAFGAAFQLCDAAGLDLAAVERWPSGMGRTTTVTTPTTMVPNNTHAGTGARSIASSAHSPVDPGTGSPSRIPPTFVCRAAATPGDRPATRCPSGFYSFNMLLSLFYPRAGSSASPRPPRCPQYVFPAPAFETGASIGSSGHHIVPTRPNPSALLAEASVFASETAQTNSRPRHERIQPPSNEAHQTGAPRMTPHPRNSTSLNPTSVMSAPSACTPEPERRAGADQICTNGFAQHTSEAANRGSANETARTNCRRARPDPGLSGSLPCPPAQRRDSPSPCP